MHIAWSCICYEEGSFTLIRNRMLLKQWSYFLASCWLLPETLTIMVASLCNESRKTAVPTTNVHCCDLKYFVSLFTLADNSFSILILIKIQNKCKTYSKRFTYVILNENFYLKVTTNNAWIISLLFLSKQNLLSRFPGNSCSITVWVSKSLSSSIAIQVLFFHDRSWSFL